MVRDNPGILLAISQAVKTAVTECRYQFKDRRWNCPTMKNVQGPNSLFGKLLNTGKTAFMWWMMKEFCGPLKIKDIRPVCFDL